ncbi:MAG: ATP-binding protein [Lactobacillaceae bacterium]|jgi:hypothetical protein|nr:ATP-binding protein [Lactobacillaceae bacterium]
MKNPFNPAFGTQPSRFLGRDEIVAAFKNAIINQNSPWRSTIITGVRGAGKTAILSSIANFIETQPKTISVRVLANEDVLNEILSQLYYQLPKDIFEHFPELTGLSIRGVQFKMNDNGTPDPDFTQNFRSQAELMLKAFAERQINVVILLDEVQKHTNELRKFVAAYQLFLQAGYPVSLLMAGLPNAIMDILNDDVLTFLRRANRVALSGVDIDLIADDFIRTFSMVDKQISRENACKAAELTTGYPYLIQLMGYYMWEMSGDEITDDVVVQAQSVAKRSVFQNVLDLIFYNATNVEQRFMVSMAMDEKRTKNAELVERLGENTSYISQYRMRLMHAGIIKPAGYGYVQFTLPYMREYIQNIIETGEYFVE